jgi:hypothetical protein
MRSIRREPGQTLAWSDEVDAMCTGDLNVTVRMPTADVRVGDHASLRSAR